MKRPPVRRPKDARRHTRHSGSRRRSPVVIPSMAIVCFLGIALFVMGVSWFRHGSHITASETISTDPFLPVTPSVQAQGISSSPTTPSQSNVSLHDVAGGSAKGQGTRSVVDTSFQYVISANLPALAQGDSYTLWLVRPSPYDFISLGSLTENGNGQFGLEWKGEAQKDYSPYTRVVVTREKSDGMMTPGEHILEGQF